MKTKSLITVIALGLGVCNCDQIETANALISDEEAIDAMIDYSQAARHFQGINNACDYVVAYSEDPVGSSIKSSTLPDITYSPEDLSSFPISIIVDYGSNGVLGLDGRVRKGKIYIELENTWIHQEGSSYIATFENYYQNDQLIEGTHTVVNLGENEDGYRVFSVDVSDGKMTNEEGEVIYFEQQTTRTCIAGDETPLNIWDNTYLIEGIQSGICSNGTPYSLSVRDNSPLEVAPICPYIKSGILDVAINNDSDMSINYFVDENNDGIADCSSSATVTINDYEIKIGSVNTED